MTKLTVITDYLDTVRRQGSSMLDENLIQKLNEIKKTDTIFWFVPLCSGSQSNLY
jgi:hypothetical protein